MYGTRYDRGESVPSRADGGEEVKTAKVAKVMKVIGVIKGVTTASHAGALAVGCAAAPKESSTLTTARGRG